METGSPYAAVILDLTIPGGMGNKEAFKKLQEITPGVNAIVSSGYPNDPTMAEYERHGFSGIIIKPYWILVLRMSCRELFPAQPARNKIDAVDQQANNKQIQQKNLPGAIPWSILPGA